MTNDGTSNQNRCRRAIACCITMFMLLTHSIGVIAQSIPDIEAPLVELEFVETATADINQVFTVQAFDDIGLGDVSLHHRRTGESAFIKSIMDPVGDTGYFSIAIDTDPSDLRSFEYYAQAIDLNGNRTVSGFAFDPFVREITAAPTQNFTSVPSTETEAVPDETESEAAVATAQNNGPVNQPATSSNRRWLYIALGVLAAGVVASQLGGGGGGGGGTPGTDTNDGDDPLVPLTVTIGDPLP